MMKKFTVFFLFLNIVLSQVDYDRSIQRYFFVEIIPKKKMTDKIIQRKHMQYIQQLTKDQKLVLAGPFKEGGGIFILKVKSIDEAQHIMDQDETIKQNINAYRIKEWYTERGLFRLEN